MLIQPSCYKMSSPQVPGSCLGYTSILIHLLFRRQKKNVLENVFTEKLTLEFVHHSAIGKKQKALLTPPLIFKLIKNKAYSSLIFQVFKIIGGLIA